MTPNMITITPKRGIKLNSYEIHMFAFEMECSHPKTTSIDMDDNRAKDASLT
jgi:hypothetical protein